MLLITAFHLLSGSVVIAVGRDMKLDLGQYYFNPSVVEHKNLYFSTARTAYMKRLNKTNWWFNEAFLCVSTTMEFGTNTCRDFNPLRSTFNECLWGSAEQVAPVDTQGIEDPKLFVWPGKGLYAIFGSKPERAGQIHCKQPVIFQQYLAQLLEEYSGSGGNWSLPHPVALRADKYPQLYRGRGDIKEKNWMPFHYRDRLYMVHSMHPHRVLEMNSRGQAVELHETYDEGLFAKFTKFDIHGGPPVLHVAGAISATQRSYFLGVFHYFETLLPSKIKDYHHYLYKFEDTPPFRVCAVSKEIPLRPMSPDQVKIYRRIWKDTSKTTYVNGLFITKSGELLLSYGSSDLSSRLLVLTMQEMENLFDPKNDKCGTGGQGLPQGVAA